MNKDVSKSQKLTYYNSNSAWYCCKRDYKAGERHCHNSNTWHIALVDVGLYLTSDVVVNPKFVYSTPKK